MAEPLFQRLCIIGPGLIGSSILRLAKERGDIARVLVTHAQSETTRTRVAELGIADVVEADPSRAVAGCDGVILCVPVGAYAGVMAKIAQHLAPGCILTDAGSTKGSVVRDLLPLLPAGVHLVPGHPMAGTEFSGPDAGFATLFEGRYTILTPLPGCDPAAVETVAELWRRAGAMIETMDHATHDKVVAIVSHLPHLIAFTICGTADDLAEETKEAVLKFAASGFRDFTRIAASDIAMWRDIFLNNREALLEMLARFSEDAHALGRAVRYGQAEFIEDRIKRGRKVRRDLIERKQA
ncbi:prephenate dehydrogenase/arogenate dehydrogenase family protein [Roseomonas hellenica]|uniref:Prephenate dehydrogenase/arogenate dehydrogenase family protein n=1 Tax=Plastoroseomonas hellenica TaxID=2687306 RepID=A0ABS5FAH5_9PROT|nr:prephenate dehydrogenase/arogenate dehydrogenase family protein [Plastoroseomonas hellenica]